MYHTIHKQRTTCSTGTYGYELNIMLKNIFSTNEIFKSCIKTMSIKMRKLNGKNTYNQTSTSCTVSIPNH